MRPAACALAAALGSWLVTPAPPEDPAVSSAPERIVANQNRSPAGRLRGGVLEVELELRIGMFRPHADDGPGVVVQAFGEPGRPLQVPGPLIRVTEGTIVHATIHNTLRDSTLVLRGLHPRPATNDDTVQVAPRGTRKLRFPAGKPGTYFYWGTTTTRQPLPRQPPPHWMDSQLHGALIVDSAGAPPHPDERLFVIGLWLKPADSTRGEPEREFMVINGKSWPNTERFAYTVGDTVRWRWVNPTPFGHPMHLHGFYYRVDSRGGWAADTIYAPAERRLVVTELMRPGGTMTAEWTPTQPGNWIFHCHFAFHVSPALYLTPEPAPSRARSAAPAHGGHSQHRMSGLVLGINVNPGRGESSVAEPADRRTIRLIAQPARAGGDSAHLMGYALHAGETEPARDSVQIPGPVLVLERGRPVRIKVVNRLAEPTAVHWHGIELESYPDGVPGWSGGPGRVFRPIEPGDSFSAEFTPPRAGTFMYHSHFSEVYQILGGLYGPLIVVEPGTSPDTATNRLVMVGALARNDSAFGVVNGRLDPSPIVLRPLRTYRFRLFNIGDARTSFALRRPDSSAVPWRAVAKDGADLPPGQAIAQTRPLMTGPGEIADFEFTPAEPGELVLDIDSPIAAWRLAVPVRVLAESVTVAR